MAQKNLGSSHLHEAGDDASPSAGVIFCLPLVCCDGTHLLKDSECLWCGLWLCLVPHELLKVRSSFTFARYEFR